MATVRPASTGWLHCRSRATECSTPPDHEGWCNSGWMIQDKLPGMVDACDLFQRAEMLAYVGDTWAQWLGPLVPGLPPFETVINSLRPKVEALVSTDDAR